MLRLFRRPYKDGYIFLKHRANLQNGIMECSAGWGDGRFSMSFTPEYLRKSPGVDPVDYGFEITRDLFWSEGPTTSFTVVNITTCRWRHSRCIWETRPRSLRLNYVLLCMLTFLNTLRRRLKRKPERWCFIAHCSTRHKVNDRQFLGQYLQELQAEKPTWTLQGWYGRYPGRA